MATIKHAKNWVTYCLAVFIAGTFTIFGRSAPSWAQEAKSSHNATIFNSEMQLLARNQTDRTNLKIKDLDSGTPRAAFPVTAGSDRAVFPVTAGSDRAVFPVTSGKATDVITRAVFPVTAGSDRAVFPVTSGKDIIAKQDQLNLDISDPVFLNNLKSITLQRIDYINAMQEITMEDVLLLNIFQLQEQIEALNLKLKKLEKKD